VRDDTKPWPFPSAGAQPLVDCNGLRVFLLRVYDVLYDEVGCYQNANPDDKS